MYQLTKGFSFSWTSSTEPLP